MRSLERIKLDYVSGGVNCEEAMAGLQYALDTALEAWARQDWDAYAERMKSADLWVQRMEQACQNTSVEYGKPEYSPKFPHDGQEPYPNPAAPGDNNSAQPQSADGGN